MARVGVLAVNVVANNRQFNSGLKDSANNSRRFARGVKSGLQPTMMSFTKTLVGAAAAILSVKSAWMSFNQAVTQGSEIAAISQRLQVSTDALQQLQFAAEQNNVSWQTLTLGMQRANRRIAEAAQGTGEAKDALMELGLSAEALNRLSPDQQLIAIARSMDLVGNNADKVRLAMKLFDSEGVSLIQTFGDLEEQMRRAQSVGAVIDEESVNRLAETDASMKSLSRQFKTFKADIANAVAPAVLGFLENMKIALEGIRELINEIRGQGGTENRIGGARERGIRNPFEEAAQRRIANERFLAEEAKKYIQQRQKDFATAAKMEEEMLQRRIKNEKKEERRLILRDMTGDPFARSMRRGSQDELRARFEPQARKSMQDDVRRAKEEAIRQTQLLNEINEKVGTQQAAPQPIGFSFIGPIN